jgi:hypothetical protein
MRLCFVPFGVFGVAQICLVCVVVSIAVTGVREVAGVQYSANKWWDVDPLIVMFVGYRVLAYLALRMGQPR